jgi:acyl-CoA thioesterase-1
MLKQILTLHLCMISSWAFAGEGPSIRYVALGDSYTIGTGAQLNESWPALCTSRLQEKGFSIGLAGNLGRNGWTSQNLIDGQLPQLIVLKPDFVTLLIGVNDWVQGVDAATFQGHLQLILDVLLKILPSPRNILIVTIPDFSVTPTGKQFSNGRDIARGITEFNQIIIKEAQSRGLKTVDLFPLSQAMGQDPSLIALDGLHPSAQEYAKWADLIEPAFESLLAGQARAKSGVNP